MKKMNSPKLEVIQFNTEDVIVTSGSVSTGFSIATQLVGKDYFTLGSEVKQGTDLDEKRNSDFYQFNFINGSFILANNNSYQIEAIDNQIWAWFDEDSNGWYTELKGKDYYYAGNNIYNWRKNNRTG